MIPEQIQIQHQQFLSSTKKAPAQTVPGQAVSELKWTRPSIFRSRYQLWSPERIVAELNIHGLFRPSGTGQSSDGSWIFEPDGRRPGMLLVRTRVSFRDEAVFEIGTTHRGGLLRLMDGRAYVFSSDFWKGRAEFQTLSGEPLIRFRTHGTVRLSADVQIFARTLQMPEVSWLTMLGWFLIVGYL